MKKSINIEDGIIELLHNPNVTKYLIRMMNYDNEKCELFLTKQEIHYLIDSFSEFLKKT